jgi:hypothetical protein
MPKRGGRKSSGLAHAGPRAREAAARQLGASRPTCGAALGPELAGFLALPSWHSRCTLTAQRSEEAAMLRMRPVSVAVALLAVTVGSGLVIALAGEPIYRHSGTVIAVERSAIVLGEVGPWKAEDGFTVVTERRVIVTRATEFVAVYRDYDDATGYLGDFREAPLVDWELLPGDIVTIECEHEGDRMIALKVTVLTGEEP